MCPLIASQTIKIVARWPLPMLCHSQDRQSLLPTTCQSSQLMCRITSKVLLPIQEELVFPQ